MDAAGTLTIPLKMTDQTPWPSGPVKVLFHGGRIEAGPAPSWLPRLFADLRLDSYAYRVMGVDALIEGGNQLRVTAYMDSPTRLDVVAHVLWDYGSLRRVDASVDLLDSLVPEPDLFGADRSYMVSFYERQDYWWGGRRVSGTGGFRNATDVAYDLLVRRNTVVQAVASMGGRISAEGQRLLTQFLSPSGMDELRHSGGSPSRGG